MRYAQAIVRPPGASYAEGLTSSGALGAPVMAVAIAQHQAYCAALRACGLKVTVLDADDAHPDSTFVEDVAVIAERVAVATRPGAPSRGGEVASMLGVLRSLGREVVSIEAPGTLDGGDVCQADDLFLIGVSARTNEHGARQLADILQRHGYRAALVDVRAVPGLLHLKSGLSYLGEGRMIVAPQMPHSGALTDFERIELLPGESYAANCLRINDRVLAAAGFPGLAAELAAREMAVQILEMSEFRKMDGALSCLSLRY
jgi:dimethylargininase